MPYICVYGVCLGTYVCMYPCVVYVNVINCLAVVDTCSVGANTPICTTTEMGSEVCYLALVIGCLWVVTMVVLLTNTCS